jgi:hypothetical protein
MAFLMLMHILGVDVLGIRARHVPESQVGANNASPIFSASRTVTNINETVAVFILALMFCVLA